MKKTILLALIGALVVPLWTAAQPTFTKITSGPLVNDRLNCGFGLWGDYDNDGLLDVLVAGPVDEWCLYHNDGNTQFSRVTSGVMGQHHLQGMLGPWGDPDNDGDLDLYAGLAWSNNDASAMYWNDGQGNFLRESVGPSWTSNGIALKGTLLAWADFDHDGFHDAFLGAAFPGVDGTTLTNALLHNDGSGTFAVVTDSVLSMKNDVVYGLFAEDYDSDGALDLVVVRAQGRPIGFYRNDGHGGFAEATPEPIRSEITYGFSAAWADFDNDGDLDVIFGGWNARNPGGLDQDRFYINNGDGTFSPWTGQPSSFEGPLPAGWMGWEAWGDFDNDGYLDLFSAGASARLWRNLGNGSFEEVCCESPVQDSVAAANSGCWVDFNNDGFLDLFVANYAGNPNYLYTNNGNSNHWLEVELQGTVSDRLAVGAKIFATTAIRGTAVRQLRTLTAYVQNQTLIAHFGLGDASAVDTLRIEWPSGTVQELTNVPANQILTITEPARLVPESAGAFKIQCWINQSFDVQASPDLATWSTVATVTNTTGTLVFHDTQDDPQTGGCFYRVVSR
jgi:enediyne biosynthesis protein E4